MAGGKARLNLLGNTKTEGRLRQYLQQVMERRYNQRFNELLEASKKKPHLPPPPGLVEVAQRLEAAGAKVVQRLQRAGAGMRRSLLAKLDAQAWAMVLRTAIAEGGLPGNIRGAIREQVLGIHENMGNLVERMGQRLARENSHPGMAGNWRLPPQRIRGAISQQTKGVRPPTNELGDYLIVALAGEPAPRRRGKAKRLWIMAVVESKSPSNKYDAFEQLRRDVERIKRDGIWINGEYYRPDEIVIDLPRPHQDPSEWTTELVAALPEDIRATPRLGEASRGTVFNVWQLPLRERDLERAAQEVQAVVRELQP